MKLFAVSSVFVFYRFCLLTLSSADMAFCAALSLISMGVYTSYCRSLAETELLSSIVKVHSCEYHDHLKFVCLVKYQLTSQGQYQVCEMPTLSTSLSGGD